MSWTVHQLAPLPPSVEEAYELVKAPIRLLIAHYLADHPASRMGEIVQAIQSERATVRLHLTAMEDVGVITASIPVGLRKAHTVLYSLDRARWTELVVRIITYLP